MQLRKNKCLGGVGGRGAESKRRFLKFKIIKFVGTNKNPLGSNF